ncbi:MAG: acetate--CoA ligase family protein [Pseudorhodoplanes sp.]|nr:acetate--CoA ligase family protein [Pseudorhodoplanes sp.]
MLEPKSVALVGVSAREYSFGFRLAEAFLGRSYGGRFDFVNPRGGQIFGHRCLQRIDEIETAPDLAVLGVGRANIESALIDAINAGARSAVIFDACYGNRDDGGSLLNRLKDIAREADLPICGGNGMGFINVQSDLVVTSFPAQHIKPGGISLIAHSGGVFTTLGMNDPRYRFDLIVSPGQEIGATIDEYISFAVERETTRCIAVFMEAARNPSGLISSLKAARDKGIPVVICKVGRSKEGARMARSHTGALTGEHTTYEAVFEDCGAISVTSADALMNTALLCSTGRIPAEGGPALITDSGGLRELQVDIAAETGTQLAQLSSQTVAALRAILPAQLTPSNPLDCASDLSDDYAQAFDQSLSVLIDAPEVSMIGLEVDLRDDYIYHDELSNLVKGLGARTRKPCFFYSSFASANNRILADELADLGVPCINGAENMLHAARNLQNWGDSHRRHQNVRDDVATLRDTRAGSGFAFSDRQSMDEHESLSLLKQFGFSTIKCAVAEDLDGLLSEIDKMQFPLALKTAQRGIDHKSDVGGVELNIKSQFDLEASYEKLASKLGPRVIVQEMAPNGIELTFGCIFDRDFGPIVMVSAGGKLVEYFKEREFAMAPFGPVKAGALITKLSISRLFQGVRGGQPIDIRGVAEALSAFSAICAELRHDLDEFEVNPVVISTEGVFAVDALAIPVQTGGTESGKRKRQA